MDAREFADEVKKGKITQEVSENICKWCAENIETLDMNDNSTRYLYEIATKYLMKYKIGKWNKEEASILITYFAKQAAKQFGINENVEIKIFDKEEYEEIFGKSSSAMCTNNGDNTFKITYSPKVLENLLSNNYDKFLRGMQTIFHEVTHALQNSVIQRKEIKGINTPKTKNSYIMALETIARKFNPGFYSKYYAHLLKENHAEKTGLKLAMETMKKYNPKLYQAYNQEVIEQRLKNYDENFYDYSITDKNGKKIDFTLTIDTLCSLYIEEHPEILETFPILQVGYNLDGSKKDLKQLISERELALKDSKNTDKINELYEMIANHRNVLTNGLKGTKDELDILLNYIEKTGTEDEFIFKLLRFRLENKTQMSSESIENLMKKEYDIAEKTRKTKQEKDETNYITIEEIREVTKDVKISSIDNAIAEIKQAIKGEKQKEVDLDSEEK